MSSMLEQAIIDAKELRETVTQLAEQKTLEKHSEEYQKLFEELLEQESGFGSDVGAGLVGGASDMGNFGEDEEASDLSDDIKASLPMSGEESRLEDDNEEINIDFDELESQLASPNSIEVPEDSTMNLNLTDEGDEELLDFDFSDNALEEEIEFDVETVPHGNVSHPTNFDLENARDIEKTKENFHQNSDELEEIRNKYFLKIKENKELQYRVDEVMDIVHQLKEHMTKTQLLNAKLLYTNKALGNNSLNERQKNLFKEKISEAQSVEQAKVIFETLKAAMGEIRTRNESQQPLQSEQSQKELSEVVSRRNTLQMESQQKQSPMEPLNEQTLRWQKLAGIKSKRK